LTVKAAAPGIVVKVVRESIYGGNIIYIAHAGSITTVYMHLSKILVRTGDEVSRGDLIGYSGGMPGTPGAGRFTTGPHMHFEVRKNGIPVNPLDYLINF
jgi:murein DD-endopeptidase MepM/ murein hydrolase activator NlpD